MRSTRLWPEEQYASLTFASNLFFFLGLSSWQTVDRSEDQQRGKSIWNLQRSPWMRWDRASNLATTTLVMSRTALAVEQGKIYTVTRITQVYSLGKTIWTENSKLWWYGVVSLSFWSLTAALKQESTTIDFFQDRGWTVPTFLECVATPEINKMDVYLQIKLNWQYWKLNVLG